MTKMQNIAPGPSLRLRLSVASLRQWVFFFIARILVLGLELASHRSLRYLDQSACLHVIVIAVNRDVAGYQRVRANALHILYHASCEIFEAEPFDIMAVIASRPMSVVVPALVVDRGGFQAMIQEIANDLIVE